MTYPFVLSRTDFTRVRRLRAAITTLGDGPLRGLCADQCAIPGMVAVEGGSLRVFTWLIPGPRNLELAEDPLMGTALARDQAPAFH